MKTDPGVPAATDEWAADDDGDHSAFTHRDDDEPPPYRPAATDEGLRAKVDGCICQTCSETGRECEMAALPNHDECPDCERGQHGERPEHPGEAGRQAMEWQGDPRLIR